MQVCELALDSHWADRESRQHLRYANQTYSRVQATAIECPANCGALQSPPSKSRTAHYTENLLLLWESGARVSTCEAHHQVHQQCCSSHRFRSSRARTAQGALSARVLRLAGGEADPGERCLKSDLDRRVRG